MKEQKEREAEAERLRLEEERRQEEEQRRKEEEEMKQVFKIFFVVGKIFTFISSDGTFGRGRKTCRGREDPEGNPGERGRGEKSKRGRGAFEEGERGDGEEIKGGSREERGGASGEAEEGGGGAAGEEEANRGDHGTNTREDSSSGAERGASTLLPLPSTAASKLGSSWGPNQAGPSGRHLGKGGSRKCQEFGNTRPCRLGFKHFFIDALVWHFVNFFLPEPEVEKGALDSLSLKSEDTENSR